MAATEVRSLAEQKRELLARSQQYRQALAADCAEVSASISWVPRTLHLLRVVSPLLVVAAPVAGWFARKKMRNGKIRVPEPATNKAKKAGFIALAFQGFRMYRQFAPVIQSVLKAWTPSRRENTQPPVRPRR